MNDIKFEDNGDSTLDVRIYSDPTDNCDWIKYGVLKKDGNSTWVLWTGTSYSDAECGFDMSDEGVSYSDDLEETENDIASELSDFQLEDDDNE